LVLVSSSCAVDSPALACDRAPFASANPSVARSTSFRRLGHRFVTDVTSGKRRSRSRRFLYSSW
jgi:hypothetical protein